MDGQMQLKQWIETSRNIVFFGGAGVSTESGIPDFRSQDGLYNQQYKYPPETIISHSFYLKNPEEFYRFYKNKMLFPEARPNAAHFALAKLEQEGKLKAVITQNIDGLHQAAGSREVLELHGSVHRNYCTRCGKFYSMEDVIKADGIPRCDCGGIIKPDVFNISSRRTKMSSNLSNIFFLLIFSSNYNPVKSSQVFYHTNPFESLLFHQSGHCFSLVISYLKGQQSLGT